MSDSTNKNVESFMKKCIHFNGIINLCCKAGVIYSEVRVGKPGMPYQFPCIKTGGECSKSKFLTQAEAEQKERELEELAASHIAMYMLAKDHYKKTKQVKATIPCVCGGQMTYAVAETNGHIRAVCPSCGQSFMQ